MHWCVHAKGYKLFEFHQHLRWQIFPEHRDTVMILDITIRKIVDVQDVGLILMNNLVKEKNIKFQFCNT